MMNEGSSSFLRRSIRLLGSIPATIDGCPILRALCEGWDSQISPSTSHNSRYNGKRICSWGRIRWIRETAGPSTSLLFVEKHFQGRAAEPQVPPLRCASVGMTRGSEGAARERRWPEPFFITMGGPQAHDSSGRDDNSVAGVKYLSLKLLRA
jgi:hypothetical protein